MRVWVLLLLASVLVPGTALGRQPPAGRPAAGPDGVGRLAEGLKSSYWPDRYRAAEALGERGPHAAPAVPALKAALGDDEHFVRMAAARALGRVGPAAAPAAAALAAALRDPQASVRYAAAEALGKVGPCAPAVLPGLLAARRDDEPRVRRAAREALAGLRPDSQGPVRTLLANLRDKDAAVRDAAAAVLARLGPADGKAVPALLAALEDPEPRVLRTAAEALGRVGTGAGTAVPALKARLGDPDAGGRAAAAAALGLVGAEAREVVPPLARRLEDRDPAVRAAAAAALGRFGWEAGPAVPALREQVNDKDPVARTAAVAALRLFRAGEVEQYLHSGQLAKGEKALGAALTSYPTDDQVRFGLGVLRFVRGVERFGQALHKYGARPENTDIPFLRLPVPRNPDAALVTYADLRRALDDFRRDLAAAEATLAGVTDDEVKLPLRLALVRLDLAGDGQATDRLIDVLKKIMLQQRLAFLRENPDFLVCFDRGDVAWLRAYCHLLMGMLDFYLAFDTEQLFDLSADGLFARPKNPFRGTDAERQEKLRDAWKAIAVKEPARLGRFRRHLLKVAELNRETWKYIRAETDDDHEWLPNPRQKGALGLPVRDEMIDAWLAMIAELEALLDGKRTFPRTFVEKNGKGLNLKTLCDGPPNRFVLDDAFFRDLPERYFSDEKEVDIGVLIRVYQVFSRDTTAVAYAAWFN